MRATSAGIVRVGRVISQHICEPTLGKGPTHATSAIIVRVRRVISQHICDPTLGKGPTHATSAIIVRVRRVISQHISDPTLGKGPTHATSARIVRVGRVISQAISDEGTVEAGQYVMDDNVRVKIIAQKNRKFVSTTHDTVQEESVNGVLLSSLCVFSCTY